MLVDMSQCFATYHGQDIRSDTVKVLQGQTTQNSREEKEPKNKWSQYVSINTTYQSTRNAWDNRDGKISLYGKRLRTT